MTEPAPPHLPGSLELPGRSLKPGWTWVKFGDVVKLNTDRIADPAAKGIERYVGLEHIEPEDLRIRRWGLVAEGTTFTSYFKPGQTLFGKRRAYQRKVAVADFEGVCSGDIYIFEPKNDCLLPELLSFICQTERFYEYAVGTSAGSLSPRTNWTQLAQYGFALPPLVEQRRMAEVLWARENLKRTLEDAVQAAYNLWIPITRHFMGVECSEDEELIIRGELVSTKQGWLITRVDDICVENRQGVQVGPFGGSVSSRYFADVGIPVLKINNITDSGELDLSELIYLNFDQAEILANRYSVVEGDLVTASQATIGRTAIVNSNISGAIISQHLIRIAVNQKVCLPEWLHSCFHTPLLLRQIHSVVQGGTRAGLIPMMFAIC